MTNAARRVGLSTPAMSHALARIRERLGDLILVRSGRGMLLTPRALALEPRVHQVVTDARNTLEPERPFVASELQRTFVVHVTDYVGAPVARERDADAYTRARLTGRGRFDRPPAEAGGTCARRGGRRTACSRGRHQRTKTAARDDDTWPRRPPPPSWRTGPGQRRSSRRSARAPAARGAGEPTAGGRRTPHRQVAAGGESSSRRARGADGTNGLEQRGHSVLAQPSNHRCDADADVEPRLGREGKPSGVGWPSAFRAGLT